MPPHKKTHAANDARGSILAAAVSSIEEGGLADLTMREVARRAGE